MTPLHLAVSSGMILLWFDDFQGNTKVIHKLMVRGANKLIRNKNGKTP